MKSLLRGLAAVVLLSGIALAGTGAPNGAHYNLNILGKDNCSGSDLTDSNRHTIQVLLNHTDQTGGYWNQQGEWVPQYVTQLDRHNKIFLQPGDFQVIDGNACDDDGATFQLPANPYTCPVDDPYCLDSDPDFQEYEVFVRELGKPGGTATMTTCATTYGADGLANTADDEVVCSTESKVLVRSTGKSSFKNVTKELTTICLDTDPTNDTDTSKCDVRYGIFDEALQTYFWDYDNTGLRLAQLRFYPVAD